VRPAAHQTALSTVIRTLAAERSPACLLDIQGMFLFVNEAWDRQATGAGTESSALIGTSWLDHIDGEELRRRNADLFARALKLRGASPRALVQVGEANTATTAALLSTRFEPVLVHGSDAVAVSIVHTVVRERPIGDVYEVVHGPDERYRGARGEVTQCPCCRRLQDPSDPSRWVLVPELLSPAAPVAHTLCELCAELHYRRDEDAC
jgi:hypothetical protein